MAGAALGTRGRLGSRSTTPTAATSGNHSGPSLSRFPVRGVRMSGAGDERLHICPFALHGTELWPRVYGGIRRTTGGLSMPLARGIPVEWSAGGGWDRRRLAARCDSSDQCVGAGHGHVTARSDALVGGGDPARMLCSPGWVGRGPAAACNGAGGPTMGGGTCTTSWPAGGRYVLRAPLGGSSW